MSRILIVLIFIATSQVMGNGLVISNTSLTGQNTSTQTWQVRFNITWENSWRDNINWDAAWVFCKYRVGTNAWGHATLSTTGFQTGSGTPITVNVACDQTGAFIYRRDAGAGTLNTTQVELRWNYGANGVLNSDVPDLNIYAIEMVYIPRGPFTIGDGNGVNSSSSGSLFAVTQHLPYTIDDLMSPNIGATSNLTNTSSSPADRIRIDGDGGLDLNLDGVVDSAFFPTGFTAFYLMKYEMTQGQYTDFLNSLTYAQQTARVNSSTNVVGQSSFDATVGTNPGRNTILVQTAGVSPGTPRVYATSRPDRHVTHLNLTDMMAYLDWAALRPMTELEFEKACRGPLAPALNEYAWGNSSANSTSSVTLSGTENGTEIITTPTGINMLSNSLTVSQGDAGTGPVRVGILATNSTNRFSAGASFYGVMGLTDMGNEVVVTLGNVAGRSFRGTNGNGLVNASGNADVANWPGASGNNTAATANVANNTGSTGAAGLQMKSSTGNTSARNNIPYTSVAARSSAPGLIGCIRGARSAFSADFAEILPNGAFISVNQSITINPSEPASTYSWTFASGNPSSSTTSNPVVSWGSAGTYNVSLSSTQGACSSTINRDVVVFPACTSPATLSGTTTWTQNNTTYANHDNATSSNYGPTRLLDGNTSGTCCSSSLYGMVTNNAGWVIFNFGSPMSLSGIGIWSFDNGQWGNSNVNLRNFSLEGSNSISGPWTFVGGSDLNPNVNNFQDVMFPPVSYQFYRMNYTSNYNYVVINEVRFFRCN